ncbi:hypothetical protein ES705_41067 [subsurface metagenome]|nr:hypothetical protein [Clostridia bacterium]
MKTDYKEDGNLTLKALARLRSKFGIKIYNPDGKLIYLLQQGQAVNYQKLLKKVNQ